MFLSTAKPSVSVFYARGQEHRPPSNSAHVANRIENQRGSGFRLVRAGERDWYPVVRLSAGLQLRWNESVTNGEARKNGHLPRNDDAIARMCWATIYLTKTGPVCRLDHGVVICVE